MLDLYGPVRSVSIVSSTRLEEPEGTQPPSPSSDTGSEGDEGDEDDEDEEHGLGVRLQQGPLGTWMRGLVGHWPPAHFWVPQSCPGWIEAYVQAPCKLQWGGWPGPHISNPSSSVSPPHQGQDQVAIMPTALEFLENHGKNILLSNGNRTATRVASYNQGIVVISQPLVPQLLVQVGLLSLSPPCPQQLLLRVTQGQPYWSKAFLD